MQYRDELFRKCSGIVVGGAALVACLLCGPGLNHAQQTRDKWQRVYTGEESIIEVNASSLKLEPDHVLRVQFRTILSHPETHPGISSAKYKTRLETIDFKPNERRYRPFEMTLLDTGGKELQSYSANELGDWRAVRAGGVTERLLNGALALPPFGRWKIVGHRFADGDSGQLTTRELDELIGVHVNLQFNRAEVGDKICALPAFVDSHQGLLRELELDLKPLGIQGQSAEMTTIKCRGTGWQPPYSLLVKVHDGEILLLWKGVFLVLRR